jgi:hypothetical protein
MKKLSYLIVLALTLGLVLTGCSLLSNISQVPATDQSGITYLTKSESDVECLAAPAVAGLLLEAAGVDNRYGTGRDGGNFIKDVANHMGLEAEFDEVSKCDIIAYECAVAAYLNDPNNNDLNNGENYPAGVTSQYAGVLDPEASEAVFADNGDGTGTLTITLKDLCGNPMEYTQRYFRANPDSIGNENYYYIGGSIISYATKASSQGGGVYTFTVTKPCGWDDFWDIGIAYGTTTDRIVIEEGLNIEIAFTPFLEGEWEIDFLISVGTWEHSMFIISHETDGTLGGNGGYPRDEVFSHEWDLDGEVTCVTDKNSEPWTDVIEVDMTIVYTTANAGYTLYLDGTVDFENKTMSGTMTGSSSGTWTATKR